VILWHILWQGRTDGSGSRRSLIWTSGMRRCRRRGIRWSGWRWSTSSVRAGVGRGARALGPGP
jgi:hypothetical protein